MPADVTRSQIANDSIVLKNERWTLAPSAVRPFQKMRSGESMIYRSGSDT